MSEDDAIAGDDGHSGAGGVGGFQFVESYAFDRGGVERADLCDRGSKEQHRQESLCYSNYTAHSFIACSIDFSRAATVGVNSSAMKPWKLRSAIALATVSNCSNCVSSSSWRPGTPTVWKCAMY